MIHEKTHTILQRIYVRSYRPSQKGHSVGLYLTVFMLLTRRIEKNEYCSSKWSLL